MGDSGIGKDEKQGVPEQHCMMSSDVPYYQEIMRGFLKTISEKGNLS